jgi:hypothetical protein
MASGGVEGRSDGDLRGQWRERLWRFEQRQGTVAAFCAEESVSVWSLYVTALLQIVLRMLADLLALAAVAFRSRWATAAEILILRRQLALYKERGFKPRRIDAAGHSERRRALASLQGTGCVAPARSAMRRR